MSKIILTKTTSAIFLTIVLVTGTIAAISPSSFFIKGVNAQGDPYYGMDNDYNSYGYSDYGMDSSYNDMKSYENDNGYYESQYSSSYKPDYKPKYPSYDKEDRRDKSKKDSSKSVNINKFNCINTNLNINGNNAGNVSIGNKGQGYLGTYSSNGGGYGSGEGYDNKQAKGFDCIINNNNNNTNIVTGGGGNVTDGGERDPCVECFRQFLNATAFADLEKILRDEGIITNIGGIGEEVLVEINSLQELCTILENVTARPIATIVSAVLFEAGIVVPTEEFPELIACIAAAFDRV